MDLGNAVRDGGGGIGLATAVATVLLSCSFGASALAATASDTQFTIGDSPSQSIAMEPAADPSGPAGPKAQVPSGNPLWAIPLKSLRATRERPLLSPSRRPPVPVAVAAPPASPPTPPKQAEPDRLLLSLVGTVVSEQDSIGIFFDETARTVLRLKTGQDHDGWTLRAISRREAKFEKQSRQATLTLPAPGAGPVSGLPVPSAAARAGETWLDGDGQLISPPRPIR